MLHSVLSATDNCAAGLSIVSKEDVEGAMFYLFHNLPTAVSQSLIQFTVSD